MKHRSSFPEWKGFERSPLGILLEIVIDQKGEMGIAYERSCDFLKERHAHDRWQLTFARAGSELRLKVFNSRASYRLTPGNASLVPPKLAHEAMGLSSIYDTFTLYPSQRLMTQVERCLGKSPGTLTRACREGVLIQRTAWLEQLVEQYFLRRVLRARDSGDGSLGFLEREICLESFRILLKTRSSDREAREGVKRAEPFECCLQLMENHLFGDLPLRDVARRGGVSLSTLTRLFRSHLKMTPYAYLKKRRMEEALLLLKNTDKSIGEIAVLVGFSNQGAFTDAFRSIYRRTPRSVRDR